MLNRLNPRGLLSVLSLVAVTVGLWIERPSLALIVPGGIVFACLVWSHLNGLPEAENGAKE